MKIFHRSDRSGHRSGSFGGPKALGKILLSVGEEYLEGLKMSADRETQEQPNWKVPAIFVYNARPEEKVMRRITKVAKGYATAEILSQIIKTENKKQETITDENQ